MFEFNYKMEDGRLVRIVNQSGVDWSYDVFDQAGELLGTVWTDGDDGTNSSLLKPVEEELLQAIYEHVKPKF
jgi:YD repeat-containing protein